MKLIIILVLFSQLKSVENKPGCNNSTCNTRWLQKYSDSLPYVDWSVNGSFEIGTTNGLLKYLGKKKFNKVATQYFSELSFTNAA